MGQNWEALLSNDLLFLKKSSPLGAEGLEAVTRSHTKDLRLATPLFQAEQSRQTETVLTAVCFNLLPLGPHRGLCKSWIFLVLSILCGSGAACNAQH